MLKDENANSHGIRMSQQGQDPAGRHLRIRREARAAMSLHIIGIVLGPTRLNVWPLERLGPR